MPAVLSTRRRCKGKQPAPAAFILPSPALRALEDEAWCELRELSEDARRKHIHWTHVRTSDPNHRQPSSFSRKQFWQHLCTVYAEVYPDNANKTGSIVLFGLTVKEKHGLANQDVLRDEHHHTAMYCSLQHYWKPIARQSLRVHNVKLHAACHDGYATMYAYLRCPSPKKPFAEIDADPLFSEDHPRGNVLQRLLEVSAARGNGRAGRKRVHAPGQPAASSEEKRFRTSDLYELAGRIGVRTATALRAHAQQLASQGELQLAEYCTVHGADLQKNLDAAWAVREAPALLSTLQSDRLGRLRMAAQNKQCTCQGVWAPGALRVLQLQGEDVNAFCSDVRKALAMGARRGTNLALVGGPGIGKSMLFESFGEIFQVYGKPERGSTFPFAGLPDADVLVWHEFVYNKRTFAFEDLLSALCGELMSIRRPGASNLPYRNQSPMFYTARKPLSVQYSDDQQEKDDYNQAMSERFCTRFWRVPLPHGERRPDFPRCGRCCARFYLEGLGAQHAPQVWP
jgi:hypothetical protein